MLTRFTRSPWLARSALLRSMLTRFTRYPWLARSAPPCGRCSLASRETPDGALRWLRAADRATMSSTWRFRDVVRTEHLRALPGRHRRRGQVPISLSSNGRSSASPTKSLFDNDTSTGHPAPHLWQPTRHLE